MRDDVIELLRERNPVPVEPPALPIESVLARLDRTPELTTDSPRGSSARPVGRRRIRPRRALRGALAPVPVLVSVALTAAIAAIALIGLHPGTSGNAASATGSRQQLIDMIGVLRRPADPRGPQRCGAESSVQTGKPRLTFPRPRGRPVRRP